MHWFFWLIISLRLLRLIFKTFSPFIAVYEIFGMTFAKHLLLLCHFYCCEAFTQKQIGDLWQVFSLRELHLILENIAVF